MTTKSKKTGNQPILIVGAPRSGTKMLRELIKLHPSVDGALYELEKVWCYGNKDKVNSKISPSDLTPDIERYIRRYFENEYKKNNRKRVIDKNVANSIRIEFVRKIFPESPIIHIVRDGRDAICSIRDRWMSPMDLKYIIKNRAFPLKELPYFIQRQIKWYSAKILKRRKYVKGWGVRFDDTNELMESLPLIELCTIQWKRCVKSARESLSILKDDQYIQVKYEDIVADPCKELTKIFEFLSLPSSEQLNSAIKGKVIAESIGRWKRDISKSELGLVMKHISDELETLGYE